MARTENRLNYCITVAFCHSFITILKCACDAVKMKNRTNTKIILPIIYNELLMSLEEVPSRDQDETVCRRHINASADFKNRKRVISYISYISNKISLKVVINVCK